MSNESYRPRRPAMLDPEIADQIVGDEDPAITTSAASTSARALLGLGDDEFTEEQVQKLAELIKTEGVDTVSALWARSSATTLPGQLWRLYLISEWFRRDPKTIQSRFSEGVSAIQSRASEKDIWLPDLDAVMGEIEQLMTGGGTDDLAGLLLGASAVLQVLAAGVSNGPEWIESDDDELADLVTRRAGALLKTAQELADFAKSLDLD